MCLSSWTAARSSGALVSSWTAARSADSLLDFVFRDDSEELLERWDGMTSPLKRQKWFACRTSPASGYESPARRHAGSPEADPRARHGEAGSPCGTSRRGVRRI